MLAAGEGAGAREQSRRKLFRRWLLAFAVALAAALLAEAVHRVWLGARDRAYDTGACRAELERLRSLAVDLTPRVGAGDLPDNPPGTEQQARFLHPFLGWEQRSSFEQWEDEARRQADPPNERDVEIAIVGGSVAEIFAGEGSGALLKTLLADARFAGRNVRIRGWARGGYKAPQPAFMVEWLLLRGVRPDAVVLIDGFNELVLSADNASLGIQPGFPSAMHWAALAAAGGLDATAVDLLARSRAAQRSAGAWTERALGWGLWRSSLLGTFARGRAAAAVGRAREALEEFGRHITARGREDVLRGPDFDAGLDAVLADSVRMWARSARLLDAVCKQEGIAFLHVLQPTLHDSGAKPATPEELAKGAASELWMRAIARGYPLLRAAGAELAADGVPFADASRVFADQTAPLYYDACHFTVEGNRILGRWIGARMLERWPDAPARTGRSDGR